MLPGAILYFNYIIEERKIWMGMKSQNSKLRNSGKSNISFKEIVHLKMKLIIYIYSPSSCV